MKTKLTFIYALILTIAPVFNACSFDNVKGSGKIIMDTRDVKDFKGIENHTSADIFIRQGNNYELKIETDHNIAPLITTKIKEEKLIISTNKNFSTRSIKIYITVPVLDNISVNGSGNITSEGTFKGTDLDIFIKGSGNIAINFEGRDAQLNIKGSGNIKTEGSFMNLIAKVHGSGDISASGKAEKTDILIQGSGNFNGYSLESTESKATIQGSGDCKLNVSRKISGKIQGSGNIHYKGEANIISIDRQGSGDVVKE